MKSKLFFTLIVPLMSFCSFLKAEIVVSEYLDTNIADWVFKKSDYAYVDDQNDCKIGWNVIEVKSGERYLSVRRNCDLLFKDQLKIHRAILKKINEKWKLNSFKYFSWGRFCSRADYSWCKSVARLSITSVDYVDYWKNYPNSRIKSPNKLFVTLANSSHSYSSLVGLFSEFGVKIRLKEVEKVFSSRLNSSPFKGELVTQPGEPNPRVMYNVGMSYFEIIKNQ